MKPLVNKKYKINKKEGDVIHILYSDNEPLEIPEELRLCLGDEPKAFKFFISLTESEQKHYVDWIFGRHKGGTNSRDSKQVD